MRRWADLGRVGLTLARLPLTVRGWHDVQMRHKTLTTVIRAAERALGRPRLAKLARLVTNEVRLDTANDLKTNGEVLVQRAARTAIQPVVFDVGCHFGEWSESLLAQPGNPPIIHAFEPAASTAEHARGVLGDRAAVHQVALSDTLGEAVLQIVHEGAGSNSLVPFAQEDRSSGQVEQITLNTVDYVCATHDLKRITLLKIDAEGHDLAVIRGAARMLTDQAIDLLQFEYNSRWIDARHFLLDAFELLWSRGYRLGKVTPRGVETYERWDPELETFREANYLAYQPPWESHFVTFPWWGDS